MARSQFKSGNRFKIDDQKGSIAVGKDADLVIVDDDIQVLTTIKAGCMHRYRSLGE